MILDLENIFTYHAPVGDQAQRYEALRAAAKDYALLVAELTPQSAEQTLAIRKIQEAAMMANAAIAINEKAAQANAVTVRAKLVCESKEHETDSPDSGEVILRPVVDGSEENADYFKYTPGGEVHFSILSPAAFAQFEPGKEYYVDFIPAN